MNNLIRLNVILLVIFIIYFPQSAAAADRILPIPKPTVDEETKIITEKKKYIYPKKKPTEKIEIIAKTLEESKESEIIYPQKKPVLFQKKVDKAVAKSAILSTADLKIAKAAFEAIKKKPIVPSDDEIKKNPPSRSAKLRYIKKVKEGANFDEFILKFKHLLDIENIGKKLW